MRPIQPIPLTRAACLATALAFTGTTFVHAATYSWDGTTGPYNVNTNWSTDITPVAADNAQLTNGGTIQISAGVIAPATGFLNNIPASNGIVEVSGGTLNSNNLQVTGGTGVFNISSGTVTVPTDARIAATNGQINISGTAIVHFPKLTLGSVAGVTGATMTVSGSAAVQMDQNGNGRELWIGGNNNGSGVLVLKDSASWTYVRKDGTTDFAIGRGTGSGVVTIQDNATLSYTAGIAAAAPIWVGGAPNFGGVVGSNMANAFNINGGTVTASGIQRFGAGNGSLNLNGGKIVAEGASANYFAGFTGTGGNQSVNLLAGGMRFDSNGFDVTTTSPLSGVGGVEKLGTGSLILSGACTYSGDTKVTAGTLVFNAAFLHDSSKLTIATDALVDLAHGIEDIVDELDLGGTPAGAGTWGSSASTATNVNDTFFAGTGVIRVGPPPVARNLTWTGGESAFWGNTAPDLNFKDASDADVAFAANDNVAFNDTSTVTTVLLSGNIQAGTVSFAGAQDWLIDGAGSGFAGGTGFAVNGTGTVTLGGTSSTFTGPIAVNSGVLKFGDNQAFGATSGIAIAAGGQVDLNGKTPGAIHSYTLAGSGPGGAGAIINSSATVAGFNSSVKHLTLTGNATIGSSAGRFDIAPGGGTITGNGHTLTKVGTCDMGFRGDASGTPIHFVINAGTVWAENTANAWGGATGTVTVKSGARVGTFGVLSIATPVTVESGGTLHNQGAGTGTWTGALAFQGNVSLDAGGGAMVLSGPITGAANVTKVFGNDITLAASALPLNVGYTGNTTVNGGRLIVEAPFFADDSDVTVATDALLRLNHAAQDTVDTLTLAGTQMAAGVWGAVGSGAPNTSDRLEGTGTLFVITGGVANPYVAWAAQITNPDDRDRADDPDGDGFTNESEYLFGTSPVANNGALVQVAGSATNLIVRWNQRTTGATYQLQESTTLTEVLWPASGVTPAVATDQNGVPADYTRMEATVPVDGAKKFVRVSGTEN
ncbi:autotransporter-associated beta strand repeat-containing protein [Luteolibacter arcticus]|uniref:Autotransporter-associated beta strand repeat-containing protein n=1 Tax=Luteolibacter arcticus TaxID=1581411 RepID=A0ABT3GJG9_9BACT|nr:autotransporter-associated beta strand repeat-containing protein [Luteolibacter arcticus]MCW1923642.1 autotransporter-associated beta strand repeat-containing protein [Luteolibacter arcticus]